MNYFSVLRTLTPRRIWNLSKVTASYYVTRLMRRPVQWGVPFSIAIEPTTACNLRCPECPSGLRAFTRETGNLKEDFFRQVIDEMGKDLLNLTFYFQGEPYINPKFLEMVKYAHDRGIFTMTSTNAHFLNEANARKTIESGLDRLIISIDGTTQETYAAYRKEGNLDNVLQGAKNIIRLKKEMKSRTPEVVFQFLVVKPNEHQIPDVQRLAKELGADALRLKTAQIYDYKNGNELIPDNTRYSRYALQSDGTYRIKNQLLNHCWKLWHSCVITWDGLVVPCCFDKDADYRLGDLKKSSFREIWRNKPYQNFRYRLLQGRDKIDICTNCTEGCKVFES